MERNRGIVRSLSVAKIIVRTVVVECSGSGCGSGGGGSGREVLVVECWNTGGVGGGPL